MALELKGVAKRVGADVHIHSTDLVLEQGAFNVLLGTTGAGKTTLMRLMAGLEKPTAGRIFHDGRDVTGVSVQRRNVSMVYQQFINYPSLDVFENIASPLRVARLGREEIEHRVERVARLLKLTPMLRRRPDELSGGQQQRTALARALVKDADVVLLDEPLANLDYKLREELREELPPMLAERGAVVVYATSEPIEALLLGGHTATLHEGRVTHFGPTGAVYRRPRDLVTAQVFSDPPLNVGRVTKRGDSMHMDDKTAWPATGPVLGLGDGEYTIGLRPHHFTPHPPARASVGLSGRVLVAEISGSESVVHLDVGGRSWVSQSHGVHAVDVGAHEEIFMRLDRLLYFDGAGALVASPGDETGG